MRRFTSDLGDAVGCDEQCLFVAHDEGSAWAWMPTQVDVARTPELVEAAKADATVSVAIGEPSRNVEGFRRTHEQARSAQSVAQTAGVDHAQVTPFVDVAPIAMLCTDLDSARRGSTRRSVTWPSTRHATPACERPLGCSLKREAATRRPPSNSSCTATPRQYRVRQAEEVRGRPMRERRLDAELALVACRWLKGAVLQPAP